MICTEEEFLLRMARITGKSAESLQARFWILPCRCTLPSCRGWLPIERTREAMDTYLLTAIPGPSITREDYEAREERRRRGGRVTYYPTNKAPDTES